MVSSTVPCENYTDCGGSVRFESQRAYSLSGCHTENGTTAKCGKCGGSDFHEDPAEKMYREFLLKEIVSNE